MDVRPHQAAGHWTHRSSRIGSAAVLAALLLSGCGSTNDPTQTPPSPPSTTSSAPTPTRSAGDHDSGTLQYTPGPSKPPAAAARTTAERFARLWVRHDIPANTWWRDLEPLCTPKLYEQLRNTDPANIPADAITGRAQAVISRRGEAVFHLRATGGGTLILGTLDIDHLGWRVVTVDFQRAS